MGLKGAKSMAAFAKSADKLKKFGRSWTRNVSMPIAGLAAVSGYMAVNFKRQMGLVATDAGGTAKEVERLEKSVLGLSRESQFGPQKLAESLFHVESSGYRGAKAMKVLNESQKLATTGNSDLQSTTYALVSATKALYGESTKNVKRTAAEINGIVAHGDMRLEELVEGFGSGLLAKAKSVGLGLRDVGAAMDVMTARGIPAQRAAYALGFTMQKLIPYGTKAEEAFASIGLGEETLINASQHGKYGYVTGLEVLQKHLDRLPTKAQQTKVIEEMFGGGRMTSGLLTDLQNLGEMKKIYGELGHEVTIYNRHTREAAEQPKVKLEKAWSSIQASLIEIGDELVPVIVPAVEKLAHYGETAANVFMSIPGPVKAIGVAALIAVGPLSSMLGYFASGTGRFLVAANGLAKAGIRFNNVMSPNVMTENSGFKNAFSAAFGGTGVAGAKQAVHGFATAIGPLVAMAGIGNIVSSATQGEWKAAGAEGAGAMIGGLSAMLIGNPELVPLFAGLGSFGGDLFVSLFKQAPQIPFVQRRLASSAKEVKTAFEGEHAASEQLARSGKGLVKAHHHQRDAARELKGAEHALAVIRGNAPAGSLKVIEGEIKVAEAIEGVTEARKKAKRAERLHGEDRNIAKEGFRFAALAGRHRKNIVKQRLSELREERRAIAAGTTGKERLTALRPVDEKITKQQGNLLAVEKKLNGLYREAANQVGPRYTHFLRKAAGAALELGSELAVVEEVGFKVNSLMEKFTPSEGPSLFGTLGIPPIAPPKGKHHHHKPKAQPKSPLQARRLSFTKPGALHINTAPPAQSGSGRDINVTIPVNLDGREVARSTAKVAKDEALLQ